MGGVQGAAFGVVAGVALGAPSGLVWDRVQEWTVGQQRGAPIFAAREGAVLSGEGEVGRGVELLPWAAVEAGDAVRLALMMMPVFGAELPAANCQLRLVLSACHLGRYILGRAVHPGALTSQQYVCSMCRQAWQRFTHQPARPVRLCSPVGAAGDQPLTAATTAAATAAGAAGRRAAAASVAEGGGSQGECRGYHRTGLGVGGH